MTRDATDGDAADRRYEHGDERGNTIGAFCGAVAVVAGGSAIPVEGARHRRDWRDDSLISARE
jgi:hypothetical protein